MARPVDPRLPERLLNDVLEAVAQLGLGDLSLRRLARTIGVSPRMLLYHFGTREGLLDAIIAETSARLAVAAQMEGSLADVVLASWARLTSPRGRGLLTVFYEVCALGARDPVRRGAVAAALFADWHALLVRRGMPPASATLLVATLHGLLLDLVLTRQRARITRALEAFVATLAMQQGKAS
jgi:AcrR family transcriptional regulator